MIDVVALAGIPAPEVPSDAVSFTEDPPRADARGVPSARPASGCAA
jgi:hypothetical protein